MGRHLYCSECRKDNKRATTTGGGITNQVDPASKNAIRQQVLARDTQKCRACGQRAYAVAYLTPPAYGGTYTDENLMAVCDVCREVGRHLTFPTIEDKVTHIRKSGKLR